ncbi:MAG: hypothetical protein JW768_15745 [Chitinispirillaceae bacterium]|nr:hypothetical protein [Chitinispirillaceae bacterium]
MRKKRTKSASYSSSSRLSGRLRKLAARLERLPLVARPFDRCAQELGMSEKRLLALLHAGKASGAIRRFAGTLKHTRAGYRYNAMVAFKVEDSTCDDAGTVLATFPFITHCYRRTAYPDWPYTLYTMVHARNTIELKRHIAKMKRVVKHQSIVVLPTVKEYKKTWYRLS